MTNAPPFDPNGRWPLEGVKVLDLGQVYNGPYAGFLMAQAGADVVKVEPLEGEAIRSRGGGGTPLAHVMLNGGKRGLAIDLKSADGKAVFLDLVDKADVLLENFAPGAMDRLGIGSDVLLRRNPRLIYGSSTGYGAWGTDKNTLAMDLTIQAYAGIMSINGPADGPPLKAGLAVVDFLGGIHLYSALMTALYERSQTGKGRVVEVAMQETALMALATSFSAMQLNGGKQPPRRGNNHPAGTGAPYNVYRCNDGYVAIICVRDSHWAALAIASGNPDAAEDPRFKLGLDRAQHEAEVDVMIEAWTSGLSKFDVAAICKEKRVPAAAVRELPEVVRDQPLHDRAALFDIDHPELGETVVPGSPLRFHGSPRPEWRLNPELGEHSGAVLSDWLGIDADVIAGLTDTGTIK
ncbi:MAG: CaiB/BaiF CoA transferase family protein [Alphaproteobacteria bacterium]|jgi:crotonobetainyl-CoA:carnitine CoA-transferase CaiB-like acyl-CoA transferase